MYQKLFKVVSKLYRGGEMLLTQRKFVNLYLWWHQKLWHGGLIYI